MEKLLLATQNENKQKEFHALLAPYNFDIVSLATLHDTSEIEESGTTFKENALIKAKTMFIKYNIPILADDSGLCVNALNGKPGVYSARFMGRDCDYRIKNQYIIDYCNQKEDRRCQYICALAYIDKLGESHIFEGKLEGIIHTSIEGDKGFGYDPIFYYQPFKTTLANVSNAQKNKISHRTKALAEFITYLLSRENV